MSGSKFLPTGVMHLCSVRKPTNCGIKLGSVVSLLVASVPSDLVAPGQERGPRTTCVQCVRGMCLCLSDLPSGEVIMATVMCAFFLAS